MGIIKKHSFKIALTALTVLYFFLRLIAISNIPIFTDEAIYIRWAQYLLNDIKFWDYSLTDGKQPFFIWLITASLFLIKDPLVAGRLVSVFAGFISMIGLIFLGIVIFKNKWIGMLSGLLYTIYPFALVYDRMALYDSLVGTFAVWGLYLVFKLSKRQGIKETLILGFVAGLGALNKTNGLFTIGLLPFSTILFLEKPFHKNKFLKYLLVSFVSILLAVFIYNLLRLSSYFHIIEQKNAIFVYPLHEWILHPLMFFWSNFWVGQRDWFFRYFGYIYSAFVVISFFINQKYLKEKILLVIWFAVPFLYLSLFGRTIYPRYIFFMTLSLLPLVAFTIYQLSEIFKNKFYSIILIALFLSQAMWVSFLILTDFSHAPIPASDINQYNNDWPAGDGIIESIDYLNNKEKSNKVALFTQGTFGLMPYGYEVYLYKDAKFIIKGIWPIGDTAPEEIINSAKVIPTYVVFYQPCEMCPGKGVAPKAWPLVEVFSKQKQASDAKHTLYKVKL